MNIKVGVDITKRSRFLASYKSGGNPFLEKIFTPYEIRENSIEQLASIFCVKEAIVKAFEIPKSQWLSISTTRKKNGKLVCSFLDENLAQKIISLDTSISHEGDIIVAVCTVIVQD